ncbi:sensor histidine kinase [Bacillaceae bacterium W0354]
MKPFRSALSLLTLYFIVVVPAVIFYTIYTFTDLSFSDVRKEKSFFNIPYLDYVFLATLGITLIFGLIYGTIQLVRRKRIENALQRVIDSKPVFKSEHERKKNKDNLYTLMEKIEADKQDRMRRIRRLASELATRETEDVDHIVEKERSRFARELHDSVSQQLFAASMLLSSITEQEGVADPVIETQLKKVEEMIQQSQLEMRALLLQLRPIALKNNTLKEGIESFLLDLMQRVPIALSWDVEDISIDKGIEDQLFRILQECISNSLRHAKSKTIEVLFIERDDFAILRIVDDGVGFNTQSTESKSYGITNIKERAYEIGGIARVVSLENYGTKIEIKVPIMKGETE